MDRGNYFSYKIYRYIDPIAKQKLIQTVYRGFDTEVKTYRKN